MALTVIGVFDNASEAQKAVEQLVSGGFSRSAIDLSAQTGSFSDTTTTDGTMVPDRHTNTSGTRTEELVDDTKDVGSSIGGFFSSLFGDDSDEKNTYADVADRHSLVTVHAMTDDEAERAADILDEAGAIDVNEKAAEYGYKAATTGTGMVAGAMTAMPATSPVDGDQTIKVIQEDLQVGKRTVETGGVRVRSRIVSKPVEESVRLREERVTLQRNPVNRVATAADLNAFKEGEISLTEHAEVPVVNKEARVVEEISVGKQVNEREEVIRDTVRNTEVDVEDTTGKTTTRTGLDSDDVTYSTK